MSRHHLCITYTKLNLGGETQLFFFPINPHSSRIHIFAATQHFYSWLPGVAALLKLKGKSTVGACFSNWGYQISPICPVCSAIPSDTDPDIGPDQRSDPVPPHARAALCFPVPLQQDVDSAPTFYPANPVFLKEQVLDVQAVCRSTEAGRLCLDQPQK